jgi:GTPase
MARGLVAIVGRPNVGKSTLFNALTRSRQAIVDDQPGVTRDRLYGKVLTSDPNLEAFTLIDTGGFETEKDSYQPFAGNIVWENTLAAIDEADVVILVFDLKSGVHPHDKDLVRLLQKKSKPTIYTVNKVDGIEQKKYTNEFFELGIDDFENVSAAHNVGLDILKDVVVEKLLEMPHLQKRRDTARDTVHIALIGRPNVGKSSFVNRLLGEQRSLVSEVAGTTRDSIDAPFQYNQKPYILIDTAGIRRRSKVRKKLEIISVIQSLNSIERADVVLLVIDAVEGMADQDQKLIARASELNKPIILLVNKWDLLQEKDSKSAANIERDLRYKMPVLEYAPILFISCLTNQRVHKVMAVVEQLVEQSRRRVPTSKLNEALHQIVQSHTPALSRKTHRRAKFYYATQVASAPPTIVVMCNVSEYLQESYKRYMHRQLQRILGFTEIPIQLIFRGKEEAKARQESRRNVGASAQH